MRSKLSDITTVIKYIYTFPQTRLKGEQSVLVPCEVATKCVLPVIRAMMAKELTTKHKLTQTEAAQRMGVSQPAISLYRRKMRGKAINLENEQAVTALIEKLSESLAKKKLTNREFLSAFCNVCMTTRAKGLMCKLHAAFDPAIITEDCNFCSNMTTCVKNV